MQPSSQTKTQPSAGVGSIWNKNSWHWEEKNYTEWSKKRVLSCLEKISFQHEDLELRVTAVRELKGEASVNIRKGKQIFLYEFQFKLDWNLESTGEGDAREVLLAGTCEVLEFNQDDDEYEIRISYKDEKSLSSVSGIAAKLKQGMEKTLTTIFGNFNKELREHDADEQKIEQDKQQRMMELERMKKAEQEKGEEKQKMLQEQKAKEQKAKIEAKSSAPIKVTASAKHEEGQGSVWNSGSYFWEEKSVNKWAEQRIRELLRSVEVKVGTIEGEITEISKLEGESSMNIRKGKKLVGYDYEITMKWKLSIKDGGGVELAQATGTLVAPEFTNSTGDEQDYEIHVNVLTDTSAGGKAKLMAKSALIPPVRKVLAQFVEELRKK